MQVPAVIDDAIHLTFMPRNKVEFKMSITGISFEFKGDFEQGQKLQKGIGDAVIGLAKLQSSAMSIEDSADAAKPVAGIVVEPSRSKRRSRKRLASPSSANGDLGTADGETAQGATSRGSTGTSPSKLVLEMRKAGYFSVKRKASEVVTELNTKGYTKINAQDLTSPLKTLCTRDVLKRSKNEDDVWVYENGEKDG